LQVVAHLEYSLTLPVGETAEVYCCAFRAVLCIGELG